MKLNLINYIQEKNLKVVKNLINNKPESVYERDEYANTPLHYAVLANDLKITTLLLKVAHHLVNTPNELGNTPLMVASSESNDEVVRILLQNHADANLKNFNGFNSAHFAACANNLKIMKLLQEYGGNILMPGILHSAVSRALVEQNWELTIWLLKQDGADILYKNNGLSVYDLMNSNETGSYIIETIFGHPVVDELIGEEAIDF